MIKATRCSPKELLSQVHKSLGCETLAALTRSEGAPLYDQKVISFRLFSIWLPLPIIHAENVGKWGLEVSSSTLQLFDLEPDNKVQEPLPVNCPMANESLTISNHLKDGSPGRGR